MNRVQAFVFSIALVLAPSLANAAGVGLRWTNCYSDGGTSNRNFACNTNLGSQRLVLTFVAPDTVRQSSGIEFTIDITSAGASLPAWWQFKGTGTCRLASLSMNFTIDPNAINCEDWGLATSSGGIAAYQIGANGPNTARLTGAMALPASAVRDIVPGVEYFTCNLTIANQKTVGTGSCAGCATPVCLTLSRVGLSSNHPGAAIVQLTGPEYGPGDNIAQWQGGTPSCPAADPDSAGFPLVTTLIGRGGILRSRYKSTYPPGSPITLVARPLTADRFSHWSGDASGNADTVQVIVDAPRTVTAHFERDPAYGPRDVSAIDVPADEGGFVQVTWADSTAEQVTERLLCCYDVQRAPMGSGDLGWQTVATISAIGMVDRTTPAPTVADSTAVNPAQARYRVRVRDSAEEFIWVSPEVIAHSLDNLPPPAPTSVSGSIASGFASIFWPAVSVPDLSHYAIYRGTEASPPIDLAHRVGTTTSTGFTDSPGYFVNYRVSAIDVHGNEGPATTFAPVIPAGVDNRPAPRSLAVEPPKPSPMTRNMAMSIGLPRELMATVDVLDAQGRVVRRLAEGQQPAGWSVVRWDATYADGRQAAAGLYFVRVHTPVGDKVARVVLLP